MAADEELVLQGLTRIGDLGALVPDKIFHLGAEADIDNQHARKEVPGNVGKARGDLMCENKQDGHYSKQLFICKAKIFRAT